MKISDNTSISMPMRNLLSILAAVAVGVWGYFGITERLTFIEHTQDLMLVEIEENDTWIDEWSPPPSVQQTTKDVQKLKTEIELLRLELEYLKATVYKK